MPQSMTQTGKLDKKPRIGNVLYSGDPGHGQRYTQTQNKIKDGWKKIYQANGEQKKAEVAMLGSDKTDFKPAKSKRHKELH